MNVRNLVVVAAAGLSAAACGATSSADSAGGSAGSSSSAIAAPASASAQTAMVNAATAAVAGKSETVLVDAQGRSLYYFTQDMAGKPTCTLGCAANWPAALLPANASKPTGAGLTGTLASVAAATGGSQLTYNGWPLYTFAGDSAPGDVHGQGVGGTWFVVTPNVVMAGGAAVSSGYNSGY